MTDGHSEDRLRCGAAVDALLDQVSAGRAGQYDAHQAGCPHCQAALGEYARLWAPVREIADTEVRAPDSVLDAVLRRIRGAAADPDYASLPGPTGTTRISARVVVVTARETAQTVTGVRAALSKLVTAGVTPVTDPDAGTRAGTARSVEPGDAPGGRVVREEGPRVVAGVSGRSTAIEVTLAAEYGTDLHQLAARIRAEVGARVRELTGLEPVAVSVRIDDVFD